MGIFDDILRVILFPLEPIVDPVIQLVNAILLMVNFIVELVKMIPKLLTVFHTGPGGVPQLPDVRHDLRVTWFEALIDVLFRYVKRWQKRPGATNAGRKKVCATSLVETIILVICPPLFIVLRQGFLTGFFPTVICFVLTYLFYVPGLVYASLYYAC